MPTDAQDIYTQVVQDLAPNEQLRLATLILNALVGQQTLTLNQSDIWTEEDQTDLLNFSLQHATATLLDHEEATF
jgi:hypothetical protein